MMQHVITIANRNNIREAFEPAKSGVNGDRVFLSDNYVIKFFEGRKEKYFKNECLIYNELKSDYRSLLIDSGIIQGIKYILMTRAKGNTLYSIWNELDTTERDSCVYQISEILKEISDLQKAQIIDFREELNLLYKDIMSQISLSDCMSKKIAEFFNYTIQFISSQEKGFLTYIDVHFDNFLYYDGRIKAIDFEALKIAPLDFQMDRWCRMSRHPQIYANNIDKKYIKDENFLELVNSMKKYYSEAFSYDHQLERLHLYSLIYNLGVIKKHNITESKMAYLLYEDLSI